MRRCKKTNGVSRIGWSILVYPTLLVLLASASPGTAQELPTRPSSATELPPEPPEAEEPPARPTFDFDVLDPRIGLRAGWMDAESAIRNLELVASLPRPEGFFNPATPGDGAFSNTDLGFGGDLLFQGNYNGFQVYDISNPADPRLRVAVVCPGGQGDVSVFGTVSSASKAFASSTSRIWTTSGRWPPCRPAGDPTRTPW